MLHEKRKIGIIHDPRSILSTPQRLAVEAMIAQVSLPIESELEAVAPCQNIKILLLVMR